MAILVTGCAGFIGSHVSRALLEAGETVMGVDNLNDYYNPAWKQENIDSLSDFANFIFFKGDITDAAFLESITTDQPLTTIVHLAAQVGVRSSIEQPVLYTQVNVQGTVQLLDFAVKLGVPQFVFASSSSVYGNQSKVPFSESDPANDPISPYAATKKAGELLCKTYAHLYGIQTTCLRFFTVYGPGGRPDMASYLFTEALLNERPIHQFGNGSTKRDYTFIDDIVQGVLAAVRTPKPFAIYNLGNNQTVSLREFIATLERVSGMTAQIVIEDPKPGDVPLTYADISKAQAELGYEPITNIEAGLSQFVEWYREWRLK
jgi:UDP-glucuronate 4-epimerase